MFVCDICKTPQGVRGKGGFLKVVLAILSLVIISAILILSKKNLI
jgi:hypothetical protein